MVEGYCVKCKAKREMNSTEETIMKGGRGGPKKAMRGICSKCGTKMYKIVGKA